MTLFLPLPEAPKEFQTVLSTIHAYQRGYSIHFTAYSLSMLIFSWKKIFYLLINAIALSLPEVESRTRPRPRTQKKSEAKAKDSLSEDRHSRGQGQECSRPRPRTKDTKRKCSPKKKKRSSQKFFRRSPKKKKKKKKKGLHKNFSGDLQKKKKNVFQKIFQAFHKILTFQKIVLSSSRGQANFRGLEASRPRPRTSKSVLEDVLEAKDVLEDSTSDHYVIDDVIIQNYCLFCCFSK